MIKKAFILTIFTLVACSSPDPESGLYPLPTLMINEGETRGFDLSVYKKQPDLQLAVAVSAEIDVRFIGDRDSLYLTPLPGSPGLVKLPLMADGQMVDLLVRINPMVEHTFTFSPNPGTKKVVVMGGFNDWSRTALPLSDGDGDGILERTVFLKPERHEYKFVVDREELIDPANPVFVSNNIGGWNSILDLSEFEEKPAGQFIKSKQQGYKLYFDFLPPEDRSLPVRTILTMNNQQLHNDVFDPQPDGGVVVNIRKLGDGLLRITGLDEQGRVIPENHTIIKDRKPLHPESHPGDWHFTVLYNLMIDRFNDGDPGNTKPVDDPDLHELANFYGGDFAGIIKKLKEGYFSDLGISTIWISPIQKQPDRAYTEWIPPNRKFTGYHGYWPVAPRKIDPRYGTEEELKRMVNLAHAQGIKVILDFVSNHVHEEHSYFKAHRNWFGQVKMPDGSMNIRNWSEETRLTTWFDEFLPSFDYNSAPEAIDQVVADALWWLETFDLDGFRQDAVKHVPHAFWKKLTAEMNLHFPEKDLFQIGETFGSDELIMNYVNPGELSSQFNFAIYFNARGPFVSDEADFTHLENVILNNLRIYYPVNLMGNITSSHDQLRFIGLADGQVSFSDNGTERSFNNPPGPVQKPTSYLKLANFHAFNVAIPGVPVIYYGDEIGLMGSGDPGNRRPMRFGSELTQAEKSLLKEISVLSKLRGKYPALALGDLLPIYNEGPVMIFLKIYFGESVLFAVNNSKTPRKVKFKLPLKARNMRNLLSSEQIELKGTTVELSLRSYAHYFFLINAE